MNVICKGIKIKELVSSLIPRGYHIKHFFSISHLAYLELSSLLWYNLRQLFNDMLRAV